MKKGVRIINCARGGLVDEQALVDALNSKHVAGAAFDVFVEEPATANVLFGHPNVICTPHLGASTTEAQENVALQVAEQMSDYLLTGAISNALNFPSITAEEAPKLKPFIELAEKLGSFAGQLTESGIVKVQITYEGHVAEMKIKALTSAALSGLLRPMLGDVNVVSAPVVAKERGMMVDEIVRAAQSDYESLITVTVTTERQERSVSGTVYADGKPRLVEIKGIRVDAEFGKSMIYVTNEDKPGFIGKFATLLGDAKINIATFHLGRIKQGGDAIALVEVDGAVPAGRARQGAGAAAGQAGQGAGVLRPLDDSKLRAERAVFPAGGGPYSFCRGGTPHFCCAGRISVRIRCQEPHSATSKGERTMREAVIVSYARTGLAKSGRGGFNITPPMSLAAHAIKHAVDRAGVDKDYVEDCYLGNCAHGAPQHRPPGGAARRPAEIDRRRIGEPLLLVGPADHRDGRQLDPLGRRRLHRRRRRREHLDPRRRHAEGIDRSGTAENRARHLHGDDRHRRHRRRALQGQPRIPGRIFAGIAAPHGRRPAGQQVQGRDRPDEDQDEGGRQGDQGREHRRLRRRQATSATVPTPRWKASPSSSR